MSVSLFERVEEAASAVRAAIPDIPGLGVVLGSGLGTLAEGLEGGGRLAYASIPHFPVPTVEGHRGNLVVGRLGGPRVVFLQGRFHDYEGHDLEAVTFPVRVLKRLGVRVLILTAAAGGINPDYRVGDVVCLADHLNLTARNPLRGPNDARLGPRFPDMTDVYSRRLRATAREESGRLGMTLREGVYACLPGPSYETPAEIRMLRTLGADVVGMSTVPEAIVARHSGMEVLAFALVTNAAAGVSGDPICHADVIETGARAVPRIGRLIEAVVGRVMCGESSSAEDADRGG